MLNGRESLAVSKRCNDSVNLAIGLIISLFLFSSCNSSRDTTRANSSPGTSTLKPNRVEVLFFHNHERCSSCTSIEKLVNEVVYDIFNEKLVNGDLVFKVMDINEKANQTVVDDYEVVWTSLYLNKWVNGQEIRDNLTTFAFTYAEQSPDVFKQGLTDQIKELLASFE